MAIPWPEIYALREMLLNMADDDCSSSSCGSDVSGSCDDHHEGETNLLTSDECSDGSKGSINDDDGNEIGPKDSVEMRNSYRTPSSDEEWSSDNDSDGIYVNNRRKHMREDSPMELNGTTKMLLDINGVLHYDTTLDPGNPSAASDKIRTKRCRISLMASDLVLVNQDGLHPKLASDLYTFNNGFVEVKESPVAGYGCFAVRDLDPQTPILVERELFCARPYNLAEKLGALTEEQMKAYDSLHWHMNTPSDDIRKAIWRTNHFAVKGGGSVFLVAARFNHACNDRNNVEYSFDFSKRCMAFVTTKKVSAGEELFIRYGSNPVHLLEVWGFRCKCGGCAGVPEDDDKDASPRAGQLHENDDWTA